LLSVIFICCHTIMPCRTLCHSDLVADHHCLKFLVLLYHGGSLW
jgi:hypothetical protein